MPLPAPRIATWWYEWLTQVWVIASEREAHVLYLWRERAQWARKHIAIAQATRSFPHLVPARTERCFVSTWDHTNNWKYLQLFRQPHVLCNGLKLAKYASCHDSEFMGILNGMHKYQENLTIKRPKRVSGMYPPLPAKLVISGSPLKICTMTSKDVASLHQLLQGLINTLSHYFHEINSLMIADVAVFMSDLEEPTLREFLQGLSKSIPPKFCRVVT